MNHSVTSPSFRFYPNDSRKGNEISCVEGRGVASFCEVMFGLRRIGSPADSRKFWLLEGAGDVEQE